MSSADSYVGPAYSAGEIHCPGCNCRPDYPSDEAMAAVAAACTCPGCMTAGKCIDDPSDEDGACVVCLYDFCRCPIEDEEWIG